MFTTRPPLPGSPNSTRTQPGIESARYIAPSIWETHHQRIAKYYVEDGMQLADLMKHMKFIHSFSATTSQWKKQLSKWEMKRNLNAVDAAHVLRLYREAEYLGLQRTVVCSTLKKSRESITSYITKSERFDSEAKLLSSIGNEPTPPHIVFHDISIQPRTPLRTHHLSPEASGSPPTPTGSASGPLSPDPSSFQTPRSNLSRSSSFVSLNMGELNIFENAERQHEWRGGHMPLSYDIDDFAEDLLSTANDDQFRKSGLDEILTTNVNGHNSMLGQLLARDHDLSASQSNELLYGALSGTPIILGRRTLEATNAREIGCPTSEGIVPKNTGSRANGDYFNPSNDYSRFLSHCFGFCISKGQEFDETADQMLTTAMATFEDMIIHENDETLTALNVLVAMLEAHGQLQMPTVILNQARSVALKHRDDPVVATIDLLLSAMKRDCHIASSSNVPMLREVHQKFVKRHGETSKSALTASYNVAWALTQEAEHEPGKYEEALCILAPLKGQCERTFGFCHVTTSSTAATLARVYFRLDRTQNAKCLIEEVIGRLDKGLPRYHPYKLEARSRQAAFLESLGEVANAELILHEVTRDRYAILGPQNPRSLNSFERLKKLLREQGREAEIEGLYQHFLEAVNDEYKSQRWKTY